MPLDKFKENYNPDESYLVRGELLNRMARSHNAISLSRHGGTGDAEIKTTISQQVSPPEGVVGIAVITSAVNLCEDDLQTPVDWVNGDPVYAADAPCSNFNKYLAKFRFWDNKRQFWQEYQEDVRLDAGAYWEGYTGQEEIEAGIGGLCIWPTNASAGPVAGPGFGQIPVYREGDVVPAIWDAHRGWAVAIHTPYSDTVRAEFHSTTVENVPNYVNTIGHSYVDCYLEAFDPDGTPPDWEILDSISWRIPQEDASGKWYDSRSGFAVIKSNSALNVGTRIRLRFVRVTPSLAPYDIEVYSSRIQFFGSGRHHADSLQVIRTTGGWKVGASLVRKGWELNTSTPGRFKDCPVFAEIAPGIIEVQHLDPCDNWSIGIHYEATISNVDSSSSSQSGSVISDQSSSSSSPSSQSSSSSSSSSSSFSSSSKSSLSSSVTSSQTNSTSSSNTSSQTNSTSSSATISTSSTLDICCCTVVTDVVTDQAGHVLEVCYSVICFPKPVGLDCDADSLGACGQEFCIEPGIESSLFGVSTPTSLGTLSGDYLVSTPSSASSLTSESSSLGVSSASSASSLSSFSESSASSPSSLSSISSSSTSLFFFLKFVFEFVERIVDFI